jgi:hypothetical protein
MGFFQCTKVCHILNFVCTTGIKGFNFLLVDDSNLIYESIVKVVGGHFHTNDMFSIEVVV